MTKPNLKPIQLSQRRTNRQSRVIRVLCGLVVSAVLSSVWLIHEKTSVSPVIIMTTSDASAIQYRFTPFSDVNSCITALPQLKAAIQQSCTTCELVADCETNSEATSISIDMFSSRLLLRFEGGSALFLHENAALNSKACQASQAALNTNSASSQLSGTNECIEFDSPEGQASTSLTAESISALVVSMWPLLLLTSTLVVLLAFSYLRHSIFDEQARLTTGHRQASGMATAVSDLISIYLSWVFLTANGVNDQTFTALNTFNNQTIACAVGLVLWFTFGAKHYRTRQSLHDELGQSLRATVAAGLIHSIAVAFTGSATLTAPLLLWASISITLPICRYLVRCEFDDRGLWRRPVLVIGRGDNARIARSAISSDFTLGYKVLELPALESSGTASEVCPIESLAHDVYQASQVVDKVRIVAALDSLQSDESQQVLNELLQMDRSIDVVPSLRGLPVLGARVSQFFGHELIMLSIHNKLSRRSHRWFKRAFDITVASLLIALISPLLIYLATRIKADGGPAFFFQDRVGLDAKPFRCMKFRSMHVDAEEQLASMLRDNPALSEEWQRNHKLENDPRITPVGKLLRSKSLDELPQLFNVLLGQMSLVGPRPLIFDELPRYGKAAELYKLVRPGMTGVWQVSGRSDTTFEERASMDEWYIRNWSLFYDVTCLIRTINVVLDSDGAY